MSSTDATSKDAKFFLSTLKQQDEKLRALALLLADSEPSLFHSLARADWEEIIGLQRSMNQTLGTISKEFLKILVYVSCSKTASTIYPSSTDPTESV